MKKFILPSLAAAMSLLSMPAFSQDKADTTQKLGLAGDGLDLYAVLDLFQKSKTIEAFEKSLNDEKTKVNNLDLDLNKKIDFIKVVTKQEGESYTFVLQVDVSKKETQDVAVILLDKDKNGKVSLQIVVICPLCFFYHVYPFSQWLDNICMFFAKIFNNIGTSYIHLSETISFIYMTQK